ncbi:SMP-30/gluconolactonase/LRE family protein [Rhodopseudomonas sp. BR0M22]|uniref:SMP-30/gluconolactonase/LRE family protein n=1 Tax=Rhodopseudomonas sp. BR0M22 TaxID=2269369 RepID=UPI0013DEABBB|nr:SMP-30/gluconolactonase/LRE family protein [Rhodopseudomonas sp. BR0M22]MCD0421888.1 SMP-30/gluconolactonase/LRE family protein [Rubrivivax sp. JA1024]
MGFFDHLLRDIRSVIDRDGGQDAIPPLDGAMSPNDRLDTAVVIGDPLPGVDDVIDAGGGAVYVSAGRRVLKLSGTDYVTRTIMAEFDGEAGGLALHPDGRLLVCVAGRGLAAIDPAQPEPRWLNDVGGRPLVGLLSVTAAPDGRIFAVEGSVGRKPDEWRRDLMEKRSNGRLISCGAGLDDPQEVLRDLPYSHGVTVSPDGASLWLTESWAHRLSRFALGPSGIGSREVIAANMPGYPARLHPDGRGGLLLAVFARRTHLIEFVLKEDDFRNDMMASMPPDYWVAPALAGGSDCLEPMQIGSVKALGIQKPWAPPRSYGLLVHLDAEGEVADSLHSRAGGRFHGLTAACATHSGVIIAARGAGCLLNYTGDLR